jgi:hypothetical protein
VLPGEASSRPQSITTGPWRAGIALAVLVAVVVAPATVLAQPVQAAQPVQSTPSRMRLDIDRMEPRLITADTPTVTFAGKVTNVGDRRIDDIRIQLRRGEAVDTERQIRTLTEEPTDSARSAFIAVAGALEPGQSNPVTITVPVRGDSGSLQIDQPGVYPLLVNVNGRPEYGGQARLAAMSVLLPALSIPAGPAASAAAHPRGVTVLWPLVDDHPRLVSAGDGTPLLSDDELATSLAAGGRLHGLLSTVAQAADVDSKALSALCFAVDPDLLRTVDLMAAGYRVTGPDGQPVDGQGTEVAKSWLTRLRDLTDGRCVIALPYADADLVALSRSGAPDLVRLALGGVSVVQELLRPVQPLSGVVWAADGTLDQRTIADLAGPVPITVLVDPARLQHAQGTAPYGVAGPATAGSVRALPIDRQVSASLADGKERIVVPDEPVLVPAGNRPVAVQNGLAALVFKAAFAGPDHGSILIAPPRRWTAPASELSAFLQVLHQLVNGGFAEVAPLTNVVSAAAQGTASGLEHTTREGSSDMAARVTAEVVRIDAAQRDLLLAMDIDDTAQISPNSLVEPVRLGLLRASSTAWRGQVDAAGRLVAEVSGQLDALCGQVTVHNPGRPLTLASGDSPIPVLLRNTMPVSVLVRIKLTDTPGLRPKPIPDVVVPAHGAVNHYLQAEVVRAGRFTLDVSLATPGGTRLGSTARLELTSSSYGAVTLIITGAAAAALFVLAGLRIARRLRAAKMAAAVDGPPVPDGVDEDQ